MHTYGYCLRRICWGGWKRLLFVFYSRRDFIQYVWRDAYNCFFLPYIIILFIKTNLISAADNKISHKIFLHKIWNFDHPTEYGWKIWQNFMLIPLIMYRNHGKCNSKNERKLKRRCLDTINKFKSKCQFPDKNIYCIDVTEELR